MKKSIITAILIVFGMLCFSASDANSWPRYRIYVAPKVYVSKPGPKYVWVEGHWKANKFGKLVWVPGHWKRI